MDKVMNNKVKMWLKPPDQMDLWLSTQGFYRKHTARDGTCLFRAVSEQLFKTQAFHIEVRRHCIEFGLFYKHLFEKMTKSSVEDRLERLKCPSEGAGLLELNIISKMYKCDFILYQEVGKPPVDGTSNGFEKKISLCVVQEKHYDSVYTKEYITDAAFCQSLIYETLYKNVFALSEVDYAVKKMLRDKSSRYQRDHTNAFMRNGVDLRLEMRDKCTNVKDLLNLGVTPFPYKVAKSLDPEIYRNVEYDTWNEYRKGLRYVKKVWNCHELGPGARCTVKCGEDLYHAFIQEMEPDKGPVLVFVEELGKKIKVDYDCLELIPMPVIPPTSTSPIKNNVKLTSSSKMNSQLQLSDSTSQSVKKNMKNGNKTKNPSGSEFKRISCDGSDENNLTCVPVISSSDYSMGPDDYQIHSDMRDCYQNQSYIPQNCEVTSSVSEIEESARISDNPNQISPNHMVQSGSHQNTLYVNGVADANNNYSSNSVPYCAVNIMPHKSVLPDCSDLPLTDISSVRYFYNLGLDYYVRSNCVTRTEIPSNGTCYPVIPSPMQFIPDPSQISYVNFAYDHPPPPINSKPSQQCSVSSDNIPPVPTASPDREPIPQSPGVVSFTSETSSSSLVHQVSSSTSNHNVAPRFKNKRKPHINNHSYSNSNNSSNNGSQQNGKYYAASPIQQPDVSTTCTSPAVPISPLYPVPIPAAPPVPAAISPSFPPPPSHAPLPTSSHYVPVQSSYTPSNAPQTYYFQPVECNNFCPVGYIEYSLVEPPPPSGIFPTVISQPPPPAQYSNTPYVTSDGIYYQPLIPNNTH